MSTASGIPDYRDASGKWKHSQPMQFQDFTRDHLARQRYWARSVVGWDKFKKAKPNTAHFALSRLEASGKISMLITQNVDRLHQRAGSINVIDLHGSLDQVVCLKCGAMTDRESLQIFMKQQNPFLEHVQATLAPDGDSSIEQMDFSQIKLKHCDYCQGVLKPDVVFYGENVPKDRVEKCFNSLQQSDAMLVVGSSLMVYSGLRFVRKAHEMGLPIALLNRGITRADQLIDIKIQQDCSQVLSQAVVELCA